MKKIALALAVIIGVGFTSCSKETDVKPAKKADKTFSGGDKRDNTGWQ